MFKNDIEDYKEKICSRFRNTASNKIDFTGFGRKEDHLPAWEFSFRLRCQSLKIVNRKRTSNIFGKLGTSRFINGAFGPFLKVP